MLTKIDELLNEVQKFHSQKKEEIEQFRIKFNGKKGILNDLFEQFKYTTKKINFQTKIEQIKQINKLLLYFTSNGLFSLIGIIVPF